jgi:hypothetical protein
VTAKFDINIFDLKQKDLINTLIACVSVGKKFNKIIFAFVHYSHDIQFWKRKKIRIFMEWRVKMSQNGICTCHKIHKNSVNFWALF